MVRGQLFNERRAQIIAEWLRAKYSALTDDELDALAQQIFDLAHFLVRRWLKERGQGVAFLERPKKEGL